MGTLGMVKGCRNGEEDEVYIEKFHPLPPLKDLPLSLANDLKAVDLGAVGELRNEAEEGYSCGTCGGGSGGTGRRGAGRAVWGSSGTVYVMPYGSSYHVSKSCRSIIAYVQEVPLTQVEYLGECSYCRGK